MVGKIRKCVNGNDLSDWRDSLKYFVYLLESDHDHVIDYAYCVGLCNAHEKTKIV